MDTTCIFTCRFWTSLWVNHGDRMVTASIRILAILVGYIVVRFVVFKIIRRLTEIPFAEFAEDVVRAREARVRAIQTVLRSTVGFILGFVAIVMILQAAGINIVPLLTTASVAGLAIGFGAQTLVRDVIAGFFILMEDQYGVGDVVTIGVVTGIVQEMGMRTTRIRDDTGKLHIISNGSVAQVCNHSR